jgi:hypothetical protein
MDLKEHYLAANNRCRCFLSISSIICASEGPLTATISSGSSVLQILFIRHRSSLPGRSEQQLDSADRSSLVHDNGDSAGLILRNEFAFDGRAAYRRHRKNLVGSGSQPTKFELAIGICNNCAEEGCIPAKRKFGNQNNGGRPL